MSPRLTVPPPYQPHPGGLTLAQIEAALDAGRLEANMGVGSGHAARWWTCRRNGRTKLWKTRPDTFRIPVKAGFRTCGHITPANADLFRIREA